MTVRRLFLNLLLVLALCTGCDRGTPEAGVDDPSTVSRIFGPENLDEARRLIATGDFDAARGVLDRYLQAHPDDPDALEMAGDGAIQANDLATAIEFFEAAVKAANNPSKELWFKWAGATITAERPFDTIAILRDAVEDYPDDLEIRQNLASFLARVGLQNEAAEHLQWLVQRKHGSQSILLQLVRFDASADARCDLPIRTPS